MFGSIPRTETEEIRVALREYRGHHYVDIRTYWRESPADDLWHPSKKGITLRPDMVAELVRLLQQAATQEKDGA